METSCAADHSPNDAAERTTVVALDQSEESFHALQWALDTLRFGVSDRLVLVHARTSPLSHATGFGGAGTERRFFSINPVPAMDYDNGYILGTEAVISMERSQEREINAFMDKAMELCREKKVKAVKHVVYGDARDVICEEIQKLNANMLVIGSHGYGAVKRTFLGSVSDYCAHHVKCPLIIVKKPHEKSHLKN
ncbi:hypothetical protein KP509_28G005600 [Ceratopteris richardii]|uniref:UspA domain-containing protein n=1 Tax=Ceratopteris richardii TaxID=49495 RepID=A0A8T2R975_CERRI|nr:hypothetical protein KP509_28G005600 [Ceratopteris richardii]